MNPPLLVVIMAGGGGTRLWPLSHDEKPKAFLEFRGKSLLQRTWERAARLTQPENIFVLALDRYTDLVASQLPGLPPQNRFAEPLRKNTGPALAGAMASLKRLRGPASPVLVLPSDQALAEEAFEAVVKGAVAECAAHQSLYTFGIAPSRPAVEFGYIEAEWRAEGFSYAARRFVEKPPDALAREFLSHGNYFWNAGIFLWTVEEFERQLAEVNPELHRLFFGDVHLVEAFTRAHPVSIDYALMEKAPRVRVIPFNAAWTDLGSWQAVWEFGPRDENDNYVDGPVTLRDVHHCLVISDRPVRLASLESYAVVIRGGETLCCPLPDTPALNEKFWQGLP
jgi:mannose-1-phosphate guanylyltransferase